MSNYDTKKELKDATGVNTSNLAAKKIALKVKVDKQEVDELDINKLVDAATGLNNLKTKELLLDVGNLNIDKLQTVPVDLKKLCYVVSKEVVKTTVYNKLNKKVNNLENKIPDAFTLIETNEYSTDKQNVEKNHRRC